MKKVFSNNTKRTIALIILGAFVFSFLHSEVDFLNYDDSNHSKHDYCEIVKNTYPLTKILQEELPKLEHNKDICIHCSDEIEAQETQTSFEIANNHLKAKPSSNLYLLNNTFLI